MFPKTPTPAHPHDTPTLTLRLTFRYFGVSDGTGAIGSRFKIDASYLSPNVNMLLSGAMHERLSRDVGLRRGVA